MKLHKLLVGAVAILAPFVAASGADADAETFRYESDIARLRSLVIHSLYSHKDVFLRELLSNANDALEKLRLVSLTEREVLNGGAANVTIAVELDEGGATGRLIVRDTGIGMTKAELARNLGTIARSGTNEFLRKAEEGGGADGNLIGQFGLGFYSCFLVSPTARVSSLPPATKENPHPEQYTFVSSASGDTFEVLPDPRGNTLGRGTEIVLEIGEDNKEFLSTNNLIDLIEKHSTFSTTFPIYVRERKQIDNPDHAPDDLPEYEHEWTHVNDKAPIWMRDPAEVPAEDYVDFYRAVSKDATVDPLGWSHFKGDTASGVSYRALMYIPATLPKDFWNNIQSGANNVRLMVKRVFITDQLGQEYMPRWLSFLKVTVDADDLPLNVSRETLQNHRFLKQLQKILIRKAIELFTRVAEDEPDKYAEVAKLYGNALRIGMIESDKFKVKIANLLRFESTRSNYTSLAEYVENRKEGQKQIYFMAGVGDQIQDLKRSPFVEKLMARGYEVLLLNLPSDEPMMRALDMYMGMRVQDVAKKGLMYGDEKEDAEEQRELAAQKIAFKPLLEWLKNAFKGQVSDVVLTNRLVTSPCTIVVENHGWSANMAKIMAAQAGHEHDPMYEMLKNMPRVLEINPKSPLIEGLLTRVLDLPEGAEEMTADEEELAETARVLFDTALIRSGFTVPDPISYFERVEALLRHNIGVSLSAKVDERVRPAPPKAAELPSEEDDEDVYAQQQQQQQQPFGGAAGGADPLAGMDFQALKDMGLDIEAQYVDDDDEAAGGSNDEWMDFAKFKEQFSAGREAHDEL